MSTNAYHIAAAACAVIIVGAVGLNLATGAEVFTKYRSEDIEAMSAGDASEDVFAGTGLDEQHGELETVDSRFAFGWLPAGGGRSALSVLTIAFPAAVVGAGALWLSRRSRGRPSTTTQESTA